VGSSLIWRKAGPFPTEILSRNFVMRIISLASILGAASAILPFVSSVKVGDKVRCCSTSNIIVRPTIQKSLELRVCTPQFGTHDTAVSTCITLSKRAELLSHEVQAFAKSSISIYYLVLVKAFYIPTPGRPLTII